MATRARGLLLLKCLRPVARGLLGLAAAGLLPGCNTGKPPSPETEGKPVGPVSRTIQLPPLFVDDVTSLQHDTPVKNDTGRPIRFTHIRQSCACQGATKLDAMELAPGQETTLHFHVDLRNRKGPQRFACHLVEEGGGAEWVYTLEITLYEKARFQEVGALHFGIVNPQAEEVRETWFYLYAKHRVELPTPVTFIAESDRVRVEKAAASVEEQPDGLVVQTIALRMHLQAPAQAGYGSTSVRAHFERQGEKCEAQTGVSWNVRTFYSVSPAQAFFGTVDASEVTPLERVVSIRRTDGAAVKILKAEPNSPAVRCSIEEVPGEMEKCLKLTVEPKEVSRALWGEVVVEMDDPVQPILKVPFAALSKQVK